MVGKERDADFVHVRLLAHIGQHRGHFDDMVERRSVAFQRGLDILHRLLGLGGDSGAFSFGAIKDGKLDNTQAPGSPLDKKS